jgi:hypothetical protein
MHAVHLSQTVSPPNQQSKADGSQQSVSHKLVAVLSLIHNDEVSGDDLSTYGLLPPELPTAACTLPPMTAC